MLGFDAAFVGYHGDQQFDALGSQSLVQGDDFGCAPGGVGGCVGMGRQFIGQKQPPFVTSADSVPHIAE